MILKYPRTPHLEGSKEQDDDDLKVVPFDEIKGKFLIIEEKVDGANCGISFEDGTMMLQSRGHYLIGNDHLQFDMFKSWAFCMQNQFYAVLGNRYVMYGEWMYAKHTCFYDALPHYFLEFDIYDKELEFFLGTQRRYDMVHDLGIVSVPVLCRRDFENPEDILSFVEESKFKTVHMWTRLVEEAEKLGLHIPQVFDQTDPDLLVEGIYVKDETSGAVDGRSKFVRKSFKQQADNGHWMRRPMLPNQLLPGVDIFA